jgi:hypothetical protein
MATTAKSSRAKSSRGRSAQSKRGASKEPAALKRLNKSLDSAQDALAALGKDVGKDVSAGSRAIYRDLQKFVKDARRHSGKLGRTMERDIAQLQKRLTGSSPTKSSRAGGTRRTQKARSGAAGRTRKAGSGAGRRTK